jgi:Rrf2 family protein
MMKLSTKSRYALRAMLELALREGQGPVQLRQIADAQDISPKYLEQLAASLRNAELVRSERGPAGGYELDRPAGMITAFDIVQAVEGPLALLECVGRSEVCSRSRTCAARGLWGRVNSAIEGALRETTLADLREAQRSAETGAAAAFCYQI